MIAKKRQCMSLSMQPQQLFLNQIDFADQSFCLDPFPYEDISPELEESIKRTGILHPPIIRERSPNRYALVTGFNRLQAFARTTADKTPVTCLLVSQQIPMHNCFLIAMEDHWLEKNISPVTKALFLNKFLQHGSRADIAGFLPLIGLKSNGAEIDSTVSLLRLEEPLLRAVHTGKLEETVARRLADLSFRDRFTLFELIDFLHLSVSNQKKLFSICQDLAKRYSRDMTTILDNEQLTAILANEKTNLPQKSAKLMQWLAGQHSPRLTQAHRESKDFINSLKIPGNMTITPSQSFENEDLTLSIKLPGKEELITILSLLRKK